MYSQYRRLFLLTALALALPAMGAQAELRVGLSSNVDPSDASPENLNSLFLGNKRHWSDGSLVKLAVLASSNVQSPFLKAVTDRSPSQYWAYWRNRVFSGRGVMPKIFHSEEEMLEYLKNEKGAIGQVTNVELAERLGAVTLSLEELPDS